MSKPVVFRCKKTGNTISFTSEGDIASTRTHECYDEVIEEVISNAEQLPSTTKVEVKEAPIGEAKEEVERSSKPSAFEQVISQKLFKKLGRPAKNK